MSTFQRTAALLTLSIGAAAAAGLLAYLVLALLKAEDL